jgi:hypothetical protein
VAAAHAPVVAPVVEPAQKKKAVTPTTAAAPAPAPAPVVAPVVDSPSKRSKDNGIVVVAGHAPVASVAPSVATAPQKQANVAAAVNAPNDENVEESSDKDSEDARNPDDSEDKSDESDEYEESEDEGGVDHRSDELLEEDEKTQHEGVDDVVAVQGATTHGNVGELVVSFCCICILFCIPYIVLKPVLYHITFLFSLRKWYSLSTRPQKTLLVFTFLVRQRLVLIMLKERCSQET